jgi:hypothetical protein
VPSIWTVYKPGNVCPAVASIIGTIEVLSTEYGLLAHDAVWCGTDLATFRVESYPIITRYER